MTNAYLGRRTFNPYVDGPSFSITLFDTYQTDSMGKSILAYKLTEKHGNQVAQIVFEGSDFACSPCHAVDSNDCFAAIMGFLTLRPGDTDQGYFESYTAEQLEFCSRHAESLGFEVSCRLGGMS